MVSNPQPRPPTISERLWTQVINDNPNSSRMVPVLANGFEDLKARGSWQEEQITAQKNKIMELDSRLNSLMKKQDLDVTSQLSEIQRQQLKLSHRIIQIMRKMETARKSGQKLSPNEEALRNKLQNLVARLSQQPMDPNSIRSLSFQLQALKETGRLDPLRSAKNYQISGGDTLNGIQSVLANQQAGLKGLVELIQKDTKDLETMRFGYQIL